MSPRFPTSALAMLASTDQTVRVDRVHTSPHTPGSMKHKNRQVVESSDSEDELDDAQQRPESSLASPTKKARLSRLRRADEQPDSPSQPPATATQREGLPCRPTPAKVLKQVDLRDSNDKQKEQPSGAKRRLRPRQQRRDARAAIMARQQQVLEEGLEVEESEGPISVHGTDSEPSSTDSMKDFIVEDDEQQLDGAEANDEEEADAMQELKGMLGANAPAKSKFLRYLLLRLRRLVGLPLEPGGRGSPDKGFNRAAASLEDKLKQCISNDNLEAWRRADPGLKARFMDRPLLHHHSGSVCWGKFCGICHHKRKHRIKMLKVCFHGQRRPSVWLSDLLGGRQQQQQQQQPLHPGGYMQGSGSESEEGGEEGSDSDAEQQESDSEGERQGSDAEWKPGKSSKEEEQESSELEESDSEGQQEAEASSGSEEWGGSGRRRRGKGRGSGGGARASRGRGRRREDSSPSEDLDEGAKSGRRPMTRQRRQQLAAARAGGRRAAAAAAGGSSDASEGTQGGKAGARRAAAKPGRLLRQNKAAAGPARALQFSSSDVENDDEGRPNGSGAAARGAAAAQKAGGSGRSRRQAVVIVSDDSEEEAAADAVAAAGRQGDSGTGGEAEHRAQQGSGRGAAAVAAGSSFDVTPADDCAAEECGASDGGNTTTESDSDGHDISDEEGDFPWKTPPPRKHPRIGVDCFARGYMQHFASQYPARLDRMAKLKVLELLSYYEEREWPASLDDLAESVVARYGCQLWLHYKEMDQWLNNFNVRQSFTVRANLEVIQRLDELMYASDATPAPWEQRGEVDIQDKLQDFQAGAAQRVGNRRWWEEFQESDSEGSEQNEYRGDVERGADSEGSDGSSDEGPSGGGGGVAGAGSWRQEQQRQRHTGRKEGGSRRTRHGQGGGGAGGTRAAAAVASAAAGLQRQFQQQQLALPWQLGSMAGGAFLGLPPSAAQQQQTRLPTSPLQGLTLNSPQQQRAQHYQASQQQQYQQRSQQHSQRAASQQQQQQPQQDYTHCFKCGQPGHWARDCPTPRAKDQCFRCKQYGHWANECPNP